MARDTSGPPRTGAPMVLEGRYRVEEVLARGGMSTVHRGTDTRLDRPVAVKIMEPSLAADPTFVRRFEREARAAARLSHPGIVAVHPQGMVHRDVKPENVLVSRSGQLKVADFGLVAAAWDGAADGSLDTGGSTSDDLILGTAAYLAPEQVQHGRTDERSDV